MCYDSTRQFSAGKERSILHFSYLPMYHLSDPFLQQELCDSYDITEERSVFQLIDRLQQRYQSSMCNTLNEVVIFPVHPYTPCTTFWDDITLPIK